MEVLHPRCAGLDVSKKDVKVCVRVVPTGRVRAQTQVTTWSSMPAQVLKLRDYLVEQAVTCVVMEATGDYWKPFYYVLEDGPFEVMLVNAHDAKNVPGRKTDVSDAAWLAQLGAHGLFRASFVPDEPIRQLRDLTRARTAITRERVREVQRVEKVLEDAGVKLFVVVSDITGTTGRAILEALIAGQREPDALADLAVRTLRAKIPEVSASLAGRFSEHHAFLIATHLRLIDQHDEAIASVTARIEEMMTPFLPARELIVSIPGVGIPTADVIVAETGADMARFPTPGHLASWTGVCPGHNESAGKSRSARARPGNWHLKGALGASALSIAAQKNTFLNVKYRRLARNRGKQKAIVAIERTLLTIIWTMLTTGALYDEPGPNWYTHQHPERAKRRALRQLHDLGYTVTLTPTGAA